MRNRRNVKTTHKPTATARCEKCWDLTLTPDFAHSLMAVRRLTAPQAVRWYHQQGHSVFTK